MTKSEEGVTATSSSRETGEAGIEIEGKEERRKSDRVY